MIDLLRDTWEYLESGGWVMIPLSVGCVLLSFLVLERLRILRTLSIEDITIRDAVHAVQHGAVAVNGGSLRARLVRSFLEHRSNDARLDMDILRECSMREASRLDTSLAFIAILVSTAPLLGLLGTVLGMIQTFQVISIFGTGNANAMANGISVALITTEAGLLIAVPGIFLSGLLLQRSSRLSLQLEEDTAILTRAVRRLVATGASAATTARHHRDVRADEGGLELALVGSKEAAR